jgi:hypothetical protein
MTPVAGDHPLLGTGRLPNVTVAFPGEVWSNSRANGVIIPGAAVAPVNVGGKLRHKQLIVGDTPDADQVGVALRQVEIPDQNVGPASLGPNEIMNQAIADGDWLRRYMTGVLHLTLVEPRADYVPGQKIGWAVAAARPAGKAAGTGAWSNAALLAGTSIFEVHEPYRVYGASNEGILTVRFLRSNN